jgi:hypothetical protein
MEGIMAGKLRNDVRHLAENWADSDIPRFSSQSATFCTACRLADFTGKGSYQTSSHGDTPKPRIDVQLGCFPGFQHSSISGSTYFPTPVITESTAAREATDSQRGRLRRARSQGPNAADIGSCKAGAE